MAQSNKNFKHYPSNSREEFMSLLSDETNKKDAKYVIALIVNNINYLDAHNIFNYENFVIILKNYGLNAIMIKNLILEFKDYMIKQKDEFGNSIAKMDWLKKRSLSKTNFSQKNIILNRLAFEFIDYLITFLFDFLQKNKIIANQIIIEQFKNKIQNLRAQSQDNSSQISVVNCNDINENDNMQFSVMDEENNNEYDDNSQLPVENNINYNYNSQFDSYFLEDSNADEEINVFY